MTLRRRPCRAPRSSHDGRQGARNERRPAAVPESSCSAICRRQISNTASHLRGAAGNGPAGSDPSATSTDSSGSRRSAVPRCRPVPTSRNRSALVVVGDRRQHRRTSSICTSGRRRRISGSATGRARGRRSRGSSRGSAARAALHLGPGSAVQTARGVAGRWGLGHRRHGRVVVEILRGEVQSLVGRGHRDADRDQESPPMSKKLAFRSTEATPRHCDQMRCSVASSGDRPPAPLGAARPRRPPATRRRSPRRPPQDGLRAACVRPNAVGAQSDSPAARPGAARPPPGSAVSSRRRPRRSRADPDPTGRRRGRCGSGRGDVSAGPRGGARPLRMASRRRRPTPPGPTSTNTRSGSASSTPSRRRTGRCARI